MRAPCLCELRGARSLGMEPKEIPIKTAVEHPYDHIKGDRSNPAYT